MTIGDSDALTDDVYATVDDTHATVDDTHSTVDDSFQCRLAMRQRDIRYIDIASHMHSLYIDIYLGCARRRHSSTRVLGW